MNRRTTSLALALALLVPATAAAQEPLTDEQIQLITSIARGDFLASALDEGLEGEAVDLVFRIEVETAPILELASTSCPVRVDVNNVGDAPIYGAWFEIRQSFERDGLPIGDGGGTSRIEIPVVPARTRLHARVECVDPPSYLAWDSRYGSPIGRSVQFSTFADVYGLEGEGLAQMSTGEAGFSLDYTTYTPGRSPHPLLWYVLDLGETGPPFQALVSRLMSDPAGRPMLFRYLADMPYGERGQAIAAAIAELPASQLNEVYSGLPVDVAGQALAMLDERAYARTERALRTTPEGRAAILALLGVTDRPEQFTAIAAGIGDDTVDAAIEALVAGSHLEEQRTALFDQLIVRARALPPERQSALAVTLFTRWIEHRIPSASFEERVLATRDMGRDAVDALLRERASAADTLFSYGALPTSMDALDLYRAITTELDGCAASQSRLRSCADAIDAHPELAAAARGGLRPELLASAQTMLEDSLDESTADVAHRWQAWGLDLGPITERACGGAGPYSYEPERMRAIAAALDPQASCLREIAEREARERAGENFRFGLGCLGIIAAALVVYFFGRRGLRHLQQVRLDDAKAHPQEEGGLIEKRIAPEPFGVAFGRGLRGTEAAIRDEGTPESEAVVKALADLKPHESALAESARELALDVVAHGKVRSELLELGDTTVYLVVVPGMHDQPQAFRRHEAFSRGWLAHVDRLKAMIGRSKLPPRLLTLFLFVRPDGTETAMLVALEDGATRYLPFGLLDEEEVQAGAGRQGTHREQWSHSEGSV